MGYNLFIFHTNKIKFVSVYKLWRVSEQGNVLVISQLINISDSFFDPPTHWEINNIKKLSEEERAHETISNNCISNIFKRVEIHCHNCDTVLIFVVAEVTSLCYY